MKSTIHELQKNNFKIVSKKFIFSAVALVAFSFAGMADTGEVEEKEEIQWIDGCAVLASVMTHVANEEHTNQTGSAWDQWTLNYIYNTHYNECNNKKSVSAE